MMRSARGGVTAADRVGQLEVFFHRAGQKPQMRQHEVPQPQRQPKEVIQGLRQVFVVRGLGDRLVELVVDLEQPTRIAGIGGHLLLPDRLEHDQVVGCGAAGRHPRGQRFQRQAQLAELIEIGRVHIGHVHAVPRGDHHQVLVRQQLQRLLDRRQRHAQLPGQLLLVDGRPRLERQRRDLVPDQLVSPLRVNASECPFRNLLTAPAAACPLPWRARGRCPARRTGFLDHHLRVVGAGAERAAQRALVAEASGVRQRITQLLELEALLARLGVVAQHFQARRCSTSDRPGSPP